MKPFDLRRHMAVTAIFVASLMIPGVATAQPDISYSVDVQPGRVAPDQIVHYEVTVTVNGNFRIEMSQAPGFGDIEVLDQASTPSVGVFNGNARRSVTVQFRLRAPSQLGTYIIEAPEFKIGRHHSKAKPATLHVVSRDSIPERSNAGEDRSQQQAFVELSLDPDRAPYVGEQVTVQYDLHINGRHRNLRARPPGEPPLDDFWVEDLTEQSRLRRGRVERYGQHWQVTPLRRFALFPIRPGPTTVDSIDIPLVTATVFGSSDQEVLESPSVQFDVKPLPPGAPDGFSSSNVGSWDLDVDIDSQSARVGGRLLVTARIDGSGRASRLAAPTFELSDAFRLISTDESSNQNVRRGRLEGQRTFEFTLMPMKEGDFEIPPLSFSYFDPDREDYVTHTSEPIPVHIEDGELPSDLDDDDVPVVQRGESSAESSPLDELHDLLEPGSISPSEKSATPIPWWAFALPIFGFFLLLIEPPITRRLRHRFSPFFARRRLRKRVFSLLDDSDDPIASRALRALRACLNDGLGLSLGALTTEEVDQALSSIALPDELHDRTVRLVSRLTTARYAPGAMATDDELEDETRAIITELLKWKFQLDDPPKSSAAATTMIVLAISGAFSLMALPAAHAGEVADPTMDYNLGTSAAKDGDLGTARLHLERALLLAPDAEPVRHNLAAVTAAVAAEDRGVASFHYHTPTAITFRSLAPWIIVISLWAALLVAISRRLFSRPATRATFLALFTTAIAVAVLSTALWICLEEFSRSAELGVVTTDELVLHQAPSRHAASATENALPAGAIIRIDETRDGWMEVELPTGARGWLPAESVGLVNP